MDRLLWNETRELDVLGLAAGEDGVINWDPALAIFLSEADRDGAGEERDDREGDDVEVEMLSGGGSVSGTLRVPRRGLGAVDTFVLAARLWA